MQQGTGPEERQVFSVVGETPLRVGRGQILHRGATHQLNQVRRDAKGQRTDTHHHHLRDSGGQRQDQVKVRAPAVLAAGLDAPAQGVHFGAHHIHAYAAAGQLGHLRCGREAGHEHQVHQVVGRQGLFRLDQAHGQGLVADARTVQARAVVGKTDRNVVALVAELYRQRADRCLATGLALLRRLDAMGHGVAQQMLESRRHALQNAPVHFDGTT